MTESPGHRPGALGTPRAPQVPLLQGRQPRSPHLGGSAAGYASPGVSFPPHRRPLPSLGKELRLRKSCKMHVFFCEVCLGSAGLSVLTVTCGMALPVTGGA